MSFLVLVVYLGLTIKSWEPLKNRMGKFGFRQTRLNINIIGLLVW